MECTFAINSTAPGFVLIQDEHSQYTMNTTLQRRKGDVSKGSINITDLPTGEYRVTVYDEMEDYLNNINPAYTSFSLVKLVVPYVLSSSSIVTVASLSPTHAASLSGMINYNILIKCTCIIKIIITIML